jgi:hypothetical protein
MPVVSDNEPAVRLRRKPSARVVEHADRVAVFPEPHPTPVLPRGWAPLEPSDEAAVLQACDEFADACRLRLGSVWDASSEYRVYCLEGPSWGGLHAATVFQLGRNSRLLAIAYEPEDAARISLDFVNWDLEAAGAGWRITLADRRAL